MKRRTLLGGLLAAPALARAAPMTETLFSARSVWNAPVAAGACLCDPGPVHAYPVGIDAMEEGGAWAIPCFAATTRDPLRPLLYNPDAWSRVAAGQWSRVGNDPSVERAILAGSVPMFPESGNVFSSMTTTGWTLPASFNRLSNPAGGPRLVRVGSDAVPEPSSDGHMVVLQPGGLALETYATILLARGAVVALSYSLTDPRGLGDGWQSGQTASMVPSYAGLIARGELANGIDHAIAVTLPAALLAPRATYPAYTFDRDALSGSPPYAGAIPMGGRLVLAGGAEAAARLPLRTAAGRRLALAAARFGMIAVDRGGGGITLRMRPDAVPAQFDAAAELALTGDLRTIMAATKLVAG